MKLVDMSGRPIESNDVKTTEEQERGDIYVSVLVNNPEDFLKRSISVMTPKGPMNLSVQKALEGLMQNLHALMAASKQKKMIIQLIDESSDLLLNKNLHMEIAHLPIIQQENDENNIKSDNDTEV